MAIRTPGKAQNKAPAAMPGFFIFPIEAAYIFKSFLGLLAQISSRSLSLIGAAFSHFVPSELCSNEDGRAIGERKRRRP